MIPNYKELRLHKELKTDLQKKYLAEDHCKNATPLLYLARK